MPLLSKEIYTSVIFQILMAMLMIAGMALASMALAVYVTLDSQDDAKAINQAGSLRMQSYRIANVLSRASEGELTNPQQALQREVTIFIDTLYKSGIGQLVEQSGNTPLQHSYTIVVSNWESLMLPLLPANSERQQAIAWPNVRQHYNDNLASYVDDIDQMVLYLQRNSEGKNELLGMIEGVNIILILFILVFFVMKADSNFVIPLRALVQAAKKVERGDFDHPITYSSTNELGLLSQTFNDMTASLKSQYSNLEQQVSERTEELRKSNLALNFLYKTSREIASSPNDLPVLNVFLADLKKLIEVERIHLFIKPDPTYPEYVLVSTVEDATGITPENCSKSSRHTSRTVQGELMLPLKNREDVYGSFYTRTQNEAEMDAWRQQLLKTVAETLSTAFAFHHTLNQERRVILHEERSTIARELHDSLAQSLSYMKLEVARLKKMIERDLPTDQVEEAINDLQQGLNAAYKHLRQLLVTFRIQLDSPDLRSALQQAVKEFDEQSAASVTLTYNLESYVLSANEDIHILHVMREALTNAIKHSMAKTIRLSCERGAEGEAIFSVEDNGVGMSENPEKQHHYGIYTMRERAQQLNGELTCTSGTAGGTRIELKLPLKSYTA